MAYPTICWIVPPGLNSRLPPAVCLTMSTNHQTQTAADLRTAIFIKGANANNLKNIDITIPKNQLVVVTGVSGSGKSSLTMDTLFAEGQRRYVESLSSYARQFLMRMKKPEVDYIRGICPAIAIEQKTSTTNAPLHGGHPDRDLRLPAPALRPRGPHVQSD